MSQVRNIVQGLFLTASAICLFTTLYLPSHFNLWVGFGFFFLLLVSFSINFALKIKYWNQKRQNSSLVKQVKAIFMGLLGASLACWFLDIITTVFVINIYAIGVELNPLGWPFGIIGVSAYFIPAIAGVYYLLYKVKTVVSFYGAVVLTALTLFMAWMNFVAGVSNFSNVLRFFSSGIHFEIIGPWLAAIIIFSAINIITIVKARKNQKVTRIVQANGGE